MFRSQWLEVISPIALPHVLKEIIVSFIGNVWMFARQLHYSNVVGVIDGNVYWTQNKQTYRNDRCIFHNIQVQDIKKIRGGWLLIWDVRSIMHHDGFHIYNKQTKILRYELCGKVMCKQVYNGYVYYVSTNAVFKWDPDTRVSIPIPNSSDVSGLYCHGNDLMMIYPNGKRLYGNT